MARSARKHTAPENQNDMLAIMAYSVLRKIPENIHTSTFLAVMVDETSDRSNKEQLALIIRRISDNFTVQEEFLELSCSVDD